MNEIAKNQSNQVTFGESNLFSRLFIYRGRESKSPEENFFTEGLAFILDHDRFLLQSLLNSIEEKSNKPWSLSKFSVNEAKIKTQKFYPSKHGRKNFIDLEIKLGDAVLWFEVKVGSDFSGENQINNYEELIEEQIPDKKNSGIILLSKSKMNVKTDQLYYRGEIYWSEIYDLIERHLVQNEHVDYMRFIEKDYLKFIEERGMMPFKPFKKPEQNAAGTMTRLDTKVNNILIHLKEELGKIYKKEFKVLNLSRSEGPGYSGQRVQAGQLEVYYAIVTEKDQFGGLDIWFYPNPDQEDKIRRSEIDLKKIRFEKEGGNFLYRSMNDLQVFENDNYPDDASDLVLKKLEELNEMLS